MHPLPATRLLATVALFLTITCAMADTTDPYLWLEDVGGDRALTWVRDRNAESQPLLEGEAGFAAMRDGIRAVLDSKEQIPYITRHGNQFYNLWQDADHPRGLWRRTTLDEYRKPAPAWETVLDLDALGKTEGESWVWGGVACLGPDDRHCLVQLSRGGADATVVREFDTVDKAFVSGGFALPEAKTEVDWIDRDTIYVGTDFGPGSMTDSGYPRVVRRWRRGTALTDAEVVFEGEKQDVAAGVHVDRTPGFERTIFVRALDFYNTRDFLLQDGRLVPIDKPSDAHFAFWRERVLIELRSDWTIGKHTWPKGSLLVGDATEYMQGKRHLEALFTPTATRSLGHFTATRSAVLLTVLDNVASRVEELTHDGTRWRQRTVEAPLAGTLSITSLHEPEVRDDPLAESYFVGYTDFLTPDSLLLGTTGTDRRELLKSRPSFFDAAGMHVEQRFAKSKDGTRVPYFIVWPKGAKPDGANPTILYGYGGFEVSMQPFYSGATGRAWTSRGGVWVLANIRGGGEFGPGWHQAALKHQRQRAFDDFAAVAQDLIATKVTSARHLGIQGGSNGGLLVGTVMLQRPELFNAVDCEVPLLDMRRYHKLLAGASWMAEYGDPDQPQDWAALAKYSPYQNVRRGMKLPTVLFITSTRDDRVHPGHARKMAARMLEMGYPVLYWENIEGGHGGAADNAQRAQMMALEYAFLWRQLR
jgi:prolyl oligopeptidase